MNRTERETIYRASWIFPMCRPPIRDGYVRLAGDRIIRVGSTKDSNGAGSDTVDLGEVALLPRMVNAHTHLEFSDCRQVIGERGIPLADWIGKVIAVRGGASPGERQKCIESGMAESIAGGVGLIGDIATTPSAYPSGNDVKIVSFAEVLGLSPERAQERYRAAEAHQTSLQDSDSIDFGVSPHAPYSTPMELVGRCVDLACRSGACVAMHVAESSEERELMEFGTGRFADSLLAAGFWREGLFPWRGSSPLAELIGRLGRAPRGLLVHGNDLRQTEIGLVAENPQLSVVYCPRTHHFFDHPKHPVQKLLDAGVRVAIGTDSRASNPDLSVWKEVQFLLKHRPDLDPYAVLQMATISGADALLGAGSEFGTITAGSGGIGSLVAVRTAGQTLDQVWRDFADGELLCTGSL